MGQNVTRGQSGKRRCLCSYVRPNPECTSVTYSQNTEFLVSEAGNAKNLTQYAATALFLGVFGDANI